MPSQVPDVPDAPHPRAPSHSIYVDDATWDRIRQLAFDQRTTASDVVRRMIEVELPKHEAGGQHGR